MIIEINRPEFLWGDAPEGVSVPLTGIEVEGEACGMLLTTRIRQSRGKETIEAAYTFPLPLQAAVCSFAAVIGGERLEAKALPRHKAEETYEEAIDSGDLPLMIESSGEGLFNANLGNLKPGDTVTIELRTAEPLHWIDGRVRVSLPTAIAPRYSADPLLPHQKTETNCLASYPVKATYRFGKGLAKATAVTSPSHRIRVSHEGDALEVELLQAYADRDLAIVLEGVSAPEGGIFVKTPQGYAAAATVTLPAPAAGDADAARREANFRILVDCSGSMEGASIQKAREALAALSEELGTGDRVTLSCFGDNVEHLIAAPHLCTPAFFRRDYLPAVRGIEADRGGTEMRNALQEVSRLSVGKSTALLVTDGDVWDEKALVKLVKDSGMQLFVLGVGFAPAESVLRKLAAKSGGAYEAVLPAEDMAEPVSRMVARMRLDASKRAKMAWEEPGMTWVSDTSPSVFAGESLTLFAFLSEPPASAPVVRVGRKLVKPEAFSWKEVAAPELGQLAARIRIAGEKDHEKAQAIALEAGILSDETNLILVKERPANEKPCGTPVFVSVPQMRVPDCDADRVRLAGSDPVILTGPSLGPVPCCEPAGVEAPVVRTARHIKDGGDLGTDALESETLPEEKPSKPEPYHDYLDSNNVLIFLQLYGAENVTELEAYSMPLLMRELPEDMFDLAEEICAEAWLPQPKKAAIVLCLAYFKDAAIEMIPGFEISDHVYNLITNPLVLALTEKLRRKMIEQGIG